MTNRSLVDNDVAIKLARFSVLDRPETTVLVGERPGVLGALVYVARAHIARKVPADRRAETERQVNAFLARAESVEPSPDELVFAEELEDAAIEAQVPLDAGESQLVAALVHRGYYQWLLTGDKRALSAAELLHARDPRLSALTHACICLEQIFAHLVGALGATAVTGLVELDRGSDRSISSCFPREVDTGHDQNVLGGLTSYIEHLRRACPNVLAQR